MLITILSVLPIVLGFGVLIFVHELGHFLAAKWAGIRAEAFAVGMGPIAVAWRRGIGLRAGSTHAEHRRRVRQWLEQQGRWSGPADRDPPMDLLIEAEEALGLDETEYSLRWLPIGGFVKMLGQDDLAPDAVSSHPRSYQRASIPRRMVVVSAGVVMNLLLAVILFVVAFLAGVRFEAPIAGGATPGSPAAAAMPVDADRLGIREPGIQPGDRIVRAGDQEVRTFGDITLAVAMSHPGEPLRLEVERPGITEPLRFELEPVRDPATRLRSIGVGLARGPQLLEAPRTSEELARSLAEHPELAAALSPGMEIVSVAGRDVRTWDEVVAAAGDESADGRPLATRWRLPGGSETVDVSLPVEPDFDLLAWPLPAGGTDAGVPGAAGISVEPGLVGLVQPLVVRDFDPSSPNRDRLAPGDVLMSVAGRDWPNFAVLAATLRAEAGRGVEVTLRRDGQVRTVSVDVSREGRIGVYLDRLMEEAIVAEPAPRLLSPDQMNDPDRFAEARPSPAAAAGITAGSVILAVDDRPVSDWASFRAALLAASATGAEPPSPMAISVRWREPGPAGIEREAALILEPADVSSLRSLRWRPVVSSSFFDAPWVDLDAAGNPITAVSMGFRETVKVVTMTYLTIDRLLRRTVGVEQLRGPVGIIDLGVQVLPRGFMYLLFLLGLISVNLAVLNFLPLPIVDGGLFLYLVYESVTGRPPPPAFQNAATLAGLLLLGTLFLVTFYNDVTRLF